MQEEGQEVMGRWCIILLFALCARQVQAQELEISGYFENQFFPQELNGKLILQNYDKLRLDLSAEAGDNISFAGDIVYRGFHGKTRFSALDFIPKRVAQDVAEMAETSVDSLRPLFAFELKDENFLDNAHVTLYFRRFELRVGKQQLPWGTGYTWNPTDIFNDKNLLDPTYEKVGVNAFRMEVPFGGEGTLTGIVGIEENWSRSTKAIKLKEHVRGFDLSASFVEKEEESVDFLTSVSASKRRRLLGGDFSGELFGLGIWGEGAHSWMEREKDFGQYLAGADYTFESGLFLTGEYYRNGRGETNEKRYSFNDWMRLLSANGENLGRDYLFIGESYPIGELWEWANYAIVNLSDRSGILFPWFDYSFGDNAEVAFVGYLPFGGEASEFGTGGAGGFARVKVYF